MIPLNCGVEKAPESPLDSKIKPSILREINPEYSLEGLMMKLKLQYFGHLMYTDDSLETSLMLGKIKGRRRASEDEMAGQHHRFNEHELGQTPGDDEGQGGLVCYSPWGHKKLDMAEQQQSYT